MNSNDILTQQEVETLIIALSKGSKANGDKGFTEQEAEFVIDWAKKIRINNAILNIALGTVRKEGDEPILAIRPDSITGALDVAVGIRNTGDPQ